jgi:hypothetical protein
MTKPRSPIEEALAAQQRGETFEVFTEESTTKIAVPTVPATLVRAPTCRVVTPPSKDACGKPAKRVIIFSDDEKAYACIPCALYMQETARAFNTVIRVEKLP